MRMVEFREGDRVTVSVQALYDSGIPLEYGRIETENDYSGEVVNYYDLYNDDGELACMDGEECRIEQVGVVLITLVNDYGESAVRLTLTRPEAEIALFKCL